MSSSPVIPIVWSYSSLKNFEGCKKRYYHEKVVGDYKQSPNEHTTYGTLMHEAIEARIKHGTPLPPEFSHLNGLVDSLLALNGEKLSEVDLSLRSDYTPCTADDPAVWYKGFADLLVINRDRRKALIADFKSGNSRYADMDQLELYALATFRHYPEVDTARGMLLFVKDDKPIAKDFSRAETEERWLRWIGRLDEIRRAREFNNWPATPSGLCRYCPVTSCMEHPSWRL
jgi:hypothetical protein